MNHKNNKCTQNQFTENKKNSLLYRCSVDQKSVQFFIKPVYSTDLHRKCANIRITLTDITNKRNVQGTNITIERNVKGPTLQADP